MRESEEQQVDDLKTEGKAVAGTGAGVYPLQPERRGNDRPVKHESISAPDLQSMSSTQLLAPPVQLDISSLKSHSTN